MNKIVISIMVFFIFLAGCPNYGAEIIQDEFINETLKNTEIQKPASNLNYNYESVERVPVKLRIDKTISTKKDGVYDGQELLFYVKKDVKYNGKILFYKGDKFTAKLETYLSRGMNGIPASIIINGFHAKDIDDEKIQGCYIKKGLNLSVMIYPIKWALTPIPGIGSLTNFIPGGNASLTPKEEVTIYYYPYWNEKNYKIKV